MKICQGFLLFLVSLWLITEPIHAAQHSVKSTCEICIGFSTPLIANDSEVFTFLEPTSAESKVIAEASVYGLHNGADFYSLRGPPLF